MGVVASRCRLGVELFSGGGLGLFWFVSFISALATLGAEVERGETAGFGEEGG